MEVENIILLLPLIAGIIIAVMMKSIKAGIGTATLAGAITFFVKSLEDGNLWYFIGGILSVAVSFCCFLDIYRIEKRQRDFKDRLGEYINTGRAIWRNEGYSNQELECKVKEWTKIVASDILTNKGRYIEGKFIDEFWAKGQYKYIESYKQKPNSEKDIKNALRSIIDHRISFLEELIEGIVYREESGPNLFLRR